MKTMYTRFPHLVKICLFFFGWLTPYFVLTANGQETYKPMLKDGRVWNCMEVHLNEEKNDTVIREYRIEGTSEIDGHICYNLCLENKLVGRYYEEGSKVFRLTDSGWELLFDFSLSAGDATPRVEGVTLTVDEVKTVVIKGVPRRCLYYRFTTVGDAKLCWIEGIGSSWFGPTYYYIVIGSLLSQKLLSVYDDDVCIFEANDFFKNGTTGIFSSLGEMEDGGVFDLVGHRLTGKPVRGIYIQNGKKFVVK